MSAPSRPSTWTALWCSDGISLSRLRELQARMKTQAGSRDSPIPLHATIPTPSAGHFSPPRRGRTTRFAQNPAFCSSGQYVSDATVAPSRERGSKPPAPRRLFGRRRVAPSRERGSKHCRGPIDLLRSRSLPHGSVDRNRCKGLVALDAAGRSLTGAWIETVTTRGTAGPAAVAPSRERGSKLPGRFFHPATVVAPSRERGSKLGSWVPGLELASSLPHGSVDRNGQARKGYVGRGASLPHGSVDRNVRSWDIRRGHSRSLPHGSVDRNSTVLLSALLSTSRSLTGAWIETPPRPRLPRPAPVAPSRERGSKRPLGRPGRAGRPVAPSRERGSKR